MKGKGRVQSEVERVSRGIFTLRDQNVILDADLAAVYGVETGALNRAVKRNVRRFPSDFIYQLVPEEVRSMRCQVGISKGPGGRRDPPSLPEPPPKPPIGFGVKEKSARYGTMQKRA